MGTDSKMAAGSAEERLDELTAAEGTQPSLSSEFYAQILDRPSCITKGICDNCDRCGF